MTERMRILVYPLITFVVLVVAWVAAIDFFSVPNYILPRPSAVLQAMYNGYIGGSYWPHVWFTFQNTAIGYFFGSVAAVLMGAILAESKSFERFVYPYIIALQSMPKVALAPLIVVWFGFGMTSKVVMVALICFFPLFINTVVGIKQTPPSLINMMRVFSASRLHIFFQLKLRAAMGHIFAGLQIGVVLSLIGAVVSEFVASSRGLGYLVSAAQANFDVAGMFAALFGLIVIGISGTQLVKLLHERVVFWEASAQGSTVVAE